MNWFRSCRNRGLIATLAVCVVTASCSHGTKYYVDKGRKPDDGRKHAEVALNYRKAIQIDPQNGEAYYVLTVYALGVALNLPSSANFPANAETLHQALIEAGRQGHIVGGASIVGLYSTTPSD